MTDMAFAEASEQNSKTLIPAMLGLVVLIVGVALRMIVGTLVTVVVIAMTVLTTMGLTGWAGLIINSSTAIAPVIVMTLTVAHSVHLLAALRYNMGEGMEKRAALVEALRVNLEPIAITSLTAAVGFLSLNFSESPPLRELGNVVAVGMVLAFLYSILFTPAAMAILPSRSKAKASSGKSAMGRLADVVVAKQKPLLYGCTAVVLLALGGITQIKLDDDFFRYFDQRYDFRVHADFTMDNLTGLHMIEYSLPSGEEQGILQPDYLKRLDEFAEWYRQSEKVVHVSAITDTIKRLNRTLHANDESYYSIPDTSDEAAQYLMLYELSVPYGLDLNSQMDVGKSASRMTITLVDVKASEVLDLARVGEAWLKENAPGIWEAADENPVRATGMSVAVSTISAHNIQSMLGGTFLALCLISLLLLFIFRNVRIALISLVPNLTPAAIAFGIWGYLFGEVNLAISVVIAMTLGIVVDDTVHLLSKYLRARREHGEDREGAVRYALHTVGMPLWVTTVALVVGFGVLATSGFAVNGDMGLLSAITIAVALIADFLLLPPILMQFDRRKMT